ncbi:MAG: hypothetical protein H7336_06805 [Bacteriovorax sp.]|nr:hypothetical protein [Bacteriovorax sp.]
MNKMVVLLTGLLIAISTLATQMPDSSIEFLKTCAAGPECEIKLFYELSKTYRPSKEEDQLRDYIVKIKTVAETSIWNQNLETFQDKIGNLMIRIPATGSFVGRNNAYFALQSHMDMVLAYADAKPGEDIRKYFAEGIKVEIKDGWLQSEGNKTTLGADNGTGVATGLRYLIDPKLSHPPMELIFTVQEEIGLLGAFNSELPLLSRKMLCLDGMTPEPGFIIAGAQGASARVLTGLAKATDTDHAQDAVIEVTVSQLARGHSGGSIHLKRLNAMKAFGNLAKFVSSTVGPIQIKNLIVGDRVLNKIPNLFKAEMVIQQSSLTSDLSYQIETYLRKLIAENTDDNQNAKIEIKIQSAAGTRFLTTDFDFTKQLIDSILQSPNGVIDSDSKYFNSVLTSSNLSFVELQPSADNSQINFQFGAMSRGFVDSRVNEIADQIQGLVSANKLSELKVEQKMLIPAWMEPESSVLLNKILTDSGLFTKKFYLNGGLEPSAFKQKFLDLEVVALGPYTLNAHSVMEKVRLDTVQPTIDGIRKIIESQ